MEGKEGVDNLLGNQNHNVFCNTYVPKCQYLHLVLTQCTSLVIYRLRCRPVFYVSLLSVLITSIVVSSNPTHDEVYSIQHYVIKFVSDLWKVGGFLRVLRFPPPIKLTATM